MVTARTSSRRKGRGDRLGSKHDARAICEEAAAQVADMMRTVVAEGTGAGGQIEGYNIAGKTGTAERAGEGGGYQENNNMASFLGFAPTDDPKARST